MPAYNRIPAGRPVVFRAPDDDIRALAEVAAQEDRSLAAELRRLVRKRVLEARLEAGLREGARAP